MEENKMQLVGSTATHEVYTFSPSGFTNSTHSSVSAEYGGNSSEIFDSGDEISTRTITIDEKLYRYLRFR